MVIIEGTAFPLDEINKNGWGVPSSEADNAITTLKNAVLRVCPRDSPHGCDLSEDPNAEIGRVLDVWREGNLIKARADITDSIASTKVEDGTWPKTWSVYTKAAALKNGWAGGVDARSLTLVTNPAWEQASWEITASDDGRLGVHVLQNFILTAQVDDTMTGQNDTPGPDGNNPGEPVVAELEKQLADAQAMIDDKDAKIGELETAVASLEKDKTEMMSIDDVKKLVAAESKKMAAEELGAYKEELARTSAMANLTASREALGLETNADEYKSLTASDLQKLADDLGSIKLSAGVQYPANTTPTAHSIGNWNAVTRQYE